MQRFIDLEGVRRALWGRAKTIKGRGLPLILVRVATWAVIKPGEQRLPDEVTDAVERGEYAVLDEGTPFSVAERALHPKAPAPRSRAQALRRAGFDPDDF